MLSKDTVETDVFIIGAGAAGIRAAMEAHDQGAGVIIATKGPFGQDGAVTWMASSGFQAAMYPPDSLEQHVKDNVEAGKYLSNQELLYEFLKYAPQAVEELNRWGVRLMKREGRYHQDSGPGNTYGRAISYIRRGEMLGAEYRKVLPNQIRRREKIKIIDDLFVIDLLKAGDNVIGAVGLDLRKGELRVVKAKSTILATGGFMDCFEFNTANPTATGDGHGIAYRAGAHMMNMEFIQFFPAACLWPSTVYGDTYPYMFVMMLYAVYYNRQGERFMERYEPKRKEWAPREATSRAITREVKEGRGSLHGGAYLSLRHLPRNFLNNFLDDLKDNPFLVGLKEAGIDIRDDAIEIGPSAHYVQGGCWVNKKCETNLPGLYAVGEVGSGGKDGADRLPGNALPLCLGMGYIAGKEAAARAKNVEMPTMDEDQLRRVPDDVLVLMKHENGVRGINVKQSVRKIMTKSMMFGRNKVELTDGILEIEKIRNEILPRLCSSATTKAFNLDLIDCLEVRNMVDCAEMALKSALMREESRGLHERSDFKDTDPNWLKYIMIEKANDKMSLFTEPVLFPYFKPG